MIIFKADENMKAIYTRTISVMDQKMEWDGNFIISNNTLILPGALKSIFFNFDDKRVMGAVVDENLNLSVNDMMNNPTLESAINISLYIFGKWGKIKGLTVDKNFKQLSALVNGVFADINVTGEVTADSCKFYCDGMPVTYEDVIEKLYKFINNVDEISDDNNEDNDDDTEDENSDEKASDTDGGAIDENSGDRPSAKMGLWHKLVWKYETVNFQKQELNPEERKRKRLGKGFYVTNYICPNCSESLFMVVYPGENEFKIDTERGAVITTRNYTCNNCNRFYTAFPFKLLNEGEVFVMDFEDDKNAYEDYLELAGTDGDKPSNNRFNRFEDENLNNDLEDTSEENIWHKRSFKLYEDAIEEAIEEAMDENIEEKSDEDFEYNLENIFEEMSDEELMDISTLDDEDMLPFEMTENQREIFSKSLCAERISRDLDYKKDVNNSENANRQAKLNLDQTNQDNNNQDNNNQNKRNPDQTKQDIVNSNESDISQHKTEQETINSGISNKNIKDKSILDKNVSEKNILNKEESGKKSTKNNSAENVATIKNMSENNTSAHQTTEGNKLSFTSNRPKVNRASKFMEEDDLAGFERYAESMDEEDLNEFTKVYQNNNNEFSKIATVKLTKVQQNDMLNQVSVVKNKSYEEMKKYHDRLKGKNVVEGLGDMKNQVLDNIKQWMNARGEQELKSIISKLPDNITKDIYKNFKKKILEYSDIDNSKYLDILEKRLDTCEQSEIKTLIGKYSKSFGNRSMLQTLIDKIKNGGYKKENSEPYLEDLKEKLYDLDEKLISQIVPEVLDLNFFEGIEAYKKIEKGPYLPELKKEYLTRINRHLEDLKKDECRNLVNKLMKDSGLQNKNIDGVYFYDFKKMEPTAEKTNEVIIINNALKTYAECDKYEYPIMIYDSTKDGEGDKGFTISADKLFYKTGLDSGYISINNIKSIYTETGLFNKGVYVKYNNGDTCKICGNIKEKDKFIKFSADLTKFIAYLKEKPQSRNVDYLAKEKHERKCCYRCGFVFSDGNICPKCGGRND